MFGRKIQPGQLIHADKHGFLVIPEEDEAHLPDACRFMDGNECRTLIPAARASEGASNHHTRSATDTNSDVAGNGFMASHHFPRAVRRPFPHRYDFPCLVPAAPGRPGLDFTSPCYDG